MATAFRDFSEYSTGELGTVGTADWTVNEGNATWTETVTADGAATGGRTLIVANNGQGSAATRMLLTSYTTSGDCEVYWRGKVAGVGTQNTDQLLGPALMDTTGQAYLLFLSSSTQVRLARANVGGGLAAYVDAAANYTVTADTYFKVRISRSGTTIRAKIWDDGASEPGTWNAGSGTDSTLTTIGAGLLYYGYQLLNGTTDVIGAGTAGNSAPTSSAAPPAANPLGMLLGVG